MTPTSEQQIIYDFVKFDSNHGLINAVAGSGKTTTIVDSAGFIDKDKSILFCAFNRAIAKEISTKFISKNLNHIQVKTLHRLGFDILKDNSSIAMNIDNNKYYKLIDAFLKNPHNSEVIKDLLSLEKLPQIAKNKFDEYQIKNYLYSLKVTLFDMCNKYRSTLMKDTLEAFKEMVTHFNVISDAKTDKWTFDSKVRVMYKICLQLIQDGNKLAEKANIIDFSDMLYLPFLNKLMPTNHYDILFIDECQDLSKSQLAIALKYVKADGRVLAVGDPNQSIYGFTGADIESFSRFSKLPNKQVVNLDLSYCFRCPTDVINLAKQFRAINEFKPKEGVVKTIEFREVVKNTLPNDLIICRLKAPLLVLMFKLLEANKKISVHEDEVKEMLNDLRFLFTNEELICKNLDNDFFDEVIERNINYVNKKANKMTDSHEADMFIVDESTLINSKVDFIKKQISNNTALKTIDAVIRNVESLIQGTKDTINLSTIHRAKGLEAQRVFILDYDKLPLHRSNQKSWERTQENNLKYVALTRTKHTLFLVNSEDDEEEETDEAQASLFDSMDIW